MPHDVTPNPSSGCFPKCAVENCLGAVTEGREGYCVTHTAEHEAATLAAFVRTELERLDGDVLKAIRATRLLLETLIVVGAHRGVLAQLRAVG